MGVDYTIQQDCMPKAVLGLPGLMGRLKGRDRAEAIIQLYRAQGDMRPVEEMGFEMVRRAADGTEEMEVVHIQHLLDAAAELVSWSEHCHDCPANRLAESFGCVGAVNYPLSLAGEQWLLARLPGDEQPLVFLLLQKALLEMGYDGQSAAALRTQSGVFFESETAPQRDVNGTLINANQVFEMLFLSGPIQPAHGSMLLQFFGGIPQNLDADVIMQLATPPSSEWLDARVPFQLQSAPSDDVTIQALKAFFESIYVAFRLGVPLLLDV